MRESMATRFERVRNHPRYALVMERQIVLPPSARPAVALAWLLFALLLLLASAVYLVTFVPFGTVVVGACGLLATERFRRYRVAVIEARTPIEPSIRIAVQIRPERNPRRWSWRRRTLVTLRGRYAPSIETVLDDSLSNRVQHGDIGIAFVRGGRLVEFVRFDV